MHPILLHLPSGVPLFSYDVFTILAAVVGVAGTYFFGRYRDLPKRALLVTLSAMLVSAFVGGRLLNIALNRSAYLAHPERILAFDSSGFSLYGGIILATMTGYFVMRAFRIDPWRFVDTGAPILGISIATMRIGCYLNGCCFGKETDLPWGVTFPVMSQAHRHHLVSHPGDFFSVTMVHPTQLYELATALILSFLSFLLLQKRLPSGAVALIFAGLFSLFRLGNSFLRVTPASFDAPTFLYPILYLGLFALSATLLRRRLRLAKSH
jgi:phosphatidylglycerol:prolipoprotein diacylglycerol transferase